ncbi:putative 1-phosphatidylinositol-4,5-bisphosphate phosphodiesterase 1 [Xylogone sp. PMI_703]|nr:putative 1-phosphatidylinositol-4,5-bisphosphate phosphodiesterase 1 [Xylogone sp. PMI_703]
MSPYTTHHNTNNSSLQNSPEGPVGRNADVMPPALDLDEPMPRYSYQTTTSFESHETVVSRKSSQSAMSDVVTKSPGLMRRLSNKASQFAGRRRRLSSSTAMSRDHSTGPYIMRRRSDSTNTAPDGGKNSPFDSDDDPSDDLLPDEASVNMESIRDWPSASASVAGSSIAASTKEATGPVIPSILLQGTTMTKVTKKKKKLLTFVLESEAAKVCWDKNKPSKSFYIDDIQEIRAGEDARNYRQEFGVPATEETRFFTIVYAISDKSKGRSQKTMHLIARNDETVELWVSTLDAISKHRHDLMASLSSFHDKAVRTYWRNEMNRQSQDRPRTEDEEDIDFNGVERLCRNNLHIHVSTATLRAKFNEADVTHTGRLNFVEFQEFVRLMKRREDVRALYREIASDISKGLTLDEFLQFISEIQGDDISDKTYWEGVFAKFVRRSKPKDQAAQGLVDGEAPRMNESALTSYLISTLNLPIAKAPAQYTLDRPMNEYYISSSHNTYLLGRQFAGQSSIEAYISALSKGCRCVEVDCWNGNDGQPVVMHGRTLTSQVSFADVMATISKYAFVKSPYPLWVSLEVHCNPQQQAIMAQIIKDTCGSKLVTSPIDQEGEQLPSPSQLLHRILIKVKKPREFKDQVLPESRVGRLRSSSLSSPYMRPTQLDNSTVSAGLLPPSNYPRIPRSTTLRIGGSVSESPEILSSSSSDSDSMIDEAAKAVDGTRKAKTSNIIKVLGELGVYSAGIKFHGFDDPESKTYNHIFSFMEATFMKNTKTVEDKRALMRHNMRYMMRVYPNGWRVASTNFDPLTYWRRGVQMAALNWQTYDLGMQMNDAMFAAGTDQSGYVLKSSDLREIKMITSVPEEAGINHTKRERKNVTFSIDVISAQQLMRPKNLPANRTFDPYIEVEVFHADDKAKDIKGVIGEGGLDASNGSGVSGIGAPHRRRTQIVQDNGFNPIFNKKFNFALTTKFPDLVFVRWTVRNSSDGHNYNDRGQPLATYTAKLSSLNQGYRTLPLYDQNGDQYLFSTLFCRTKIEPATSIYVDGPEMTPSVGKFKSIRQTFSRNSSSPRPSTDSNHS